ncbi:MAG: ABC transporter substrate-binding protein [Acidimicrobiales bacterium]
MPSYDRRSFLANGLKTGAALGAIGLGGTVLDACGSGSGAPSTTLTHKKALTVGVKPNTKGKMGGAVAFGTEAEETGMDPTQAHFDSTGVLYARCVYDPLTIVLQDGSVVPYLAESVTPNKTYTKWRIKVRKNVVFHDGTPCDADAMAFCMRAFLTSPLTNFAFTNYMNTKVPGAAVQKIDNLTIQMNMEAPWVPFPYWLAGYIGGQIAYMFSPTQYKKGEAVLNLHPIGTGPFKLQQWQVGNFFHCVRNPHYWRKDAFGRQLPYLDSFTYRPQPDPATRYSELQSGTTDMMHTDVDQTIQEILSNSALDAIGDNELSVGEPDCTFAMIRCNDPVMKDIRLRRALAYATDQKTINAVLGRNITTPTSGPFPAPSPYAGSTGYPEYNPAKAAALVKSWMADHGGKAPAVTFTTTNSPTSSQDATFITDQWLPSALGGTGFDVTVAQVAQAALINDAIFGKFQIFSWRQFANVDPDLNYVFWAETSGIVNFAHNEDPKIQTALDKARQTADQSVRKAQYQEVATRFGADCPYIWQGRDVWYVAAAKNVMNFNNQTSPEGKRGVTMLSGITWPTEVWID